MVFLVQDSNRSKEFSQYIKGNSKEQNASKQSSSELDHENTSDKKRSQENENQKEGQRLQKTERAKTSSAGMEL